MQDEHDVAEALFCLSNMAARELEKYSDSDTETKKRGPPMGKEAAIPSSISTAKRQRVRSEQDNLIGNDLQVSSQADKKATTASLEATLVKDEPVADTAELAKASVKAPSKPKLGLAKGNVAVKQELKHVPPPKRESDKSDTLSEKKVQPAGIKTVKPPSKPKRENVVKVEPEIPGVIAQKFKESAVPPSASNHFADPTPYAPRRNFKRCASHVYIAHFIEMQQKALLASSGDPYREAIQANNYKKQLERPAVREQKALPPALSHAARETKGEYAATASKQTNPAQEKAVGLNKSLLANHRPASSVQYPSPLAAEYLQPVSQLKPALAQQFPNSGFPFQFPPGHAFAAGMPYAMAAGSRGLPTHYFGPALGLGMPHAAPGLPHGAGPLAGL
eukprot:scaffold186263_cov52-Prasinocladus_malaysianus.AAC.1